jgi:cbb3-type cytochrome oxidase cytochrome c subunit
MKKPWVIITLVIIAALIIIQFFQPEKNITKAATTDEIFFQVQCDQLVKKNIVNACFDCHSNNTRYPFYFKFAPVSWMMARHVKEGKSKLNFSEWAKYDKKEQLKHLDDICEVVTDGEMPLKSYTFMHSSAILNKDDVENICKWTDTASEEVFNK